MKASEGRIGRVFMVRLEDGDELPGCLESFAAEKGIKHGQVVLVEKLARPPDIGAPCRAINGDFGFCHFVDSFLDIANAL